MINAIHDRVSDAAQAGNVSASTGCPLSSADAERWWCFKSDAKSANPRSLGNVTQTVSDVVGRRQSRRIPSDRRHKNVCKPQLKFDRRVPVSKTVEPTSPAGVGTVETVGHHALGLADRFDGVIRGGMKLKQPHATLNLHGDDRLRFWEVPVNPDDQLEDDLAFITSEDELITPIDQRSDANDDPDNIEEANDEDDEDEDEDDPAGML